MYLAEEDVVIGITATDDTDVDSCYYNLTSILYNVYNVEITDCSSTTNFLSIDGVYTLKVWIYDTAGNIDTDITTFEMQKESGTSGGGGGSSTYTTITESLITSDVTNITSASIVNESEVDTTIDDVLSKIDIPYQQAAIVIGAVALISLIFVFSVNLKIKKFGSKNGR